MREAMTWAPGAGSRRARRLSVAAYAFLAASAVAMVPYLVGSPLGGLAFLATGLGCMAAIGVGMVLSSGARRRPWWWVLVAAGLFLLGAVGRQVAPGTGWVGFLPDTASIAGYVAFFLALRCWLNAGDGDRSRQDFLDALLVGMGAAFAAWAFLIVPAFTDSAGDPVRRAVIAVYPVLDTVLLAVAARILFSRKVQSTALWLLFAVLGAIFAGDMVYAVAAAGGSPVPVVADAPYFLAYGAMGAAALHPSMQRLSRPVPRTFRGWSRPHLVGIGLPLFSPAVLMVAVPAANTADRVVRAVLIAGMTGIVLYRSMQAINRYASSEQDARHRATHDTLTGLPNRQGLQVYLERELPAAAASEQSVSVLFMDLDGFKFVNDSYGHGVGDELLVQAADRIRSHVRDGDFVARIGGDEFVAVARHADLAGAEGLADRVINSFHTPFALSVGPTFISPSVGIARSGAHRLSDPDVLVREADTAMYKAKAGGRNRSAVFDSSLREAVRTRVETENGLRQALDDDQLVVHYQPVVDLVDGTVLSYEALLRWQHPARGLVAPGEFVPIAEDSWLIVPIGSWVLRRALRDLAAWRRAGRPDLQVAVNVSARQLRDTNLVELVTRALAENDLPGDALCLELTESALVLDPDTAQATLAALHRIGVAVAVDDFGTGYSALGYLRRFPVSTVKIDRTFVADLGTGRDEAIVRAIIAMSHVLGVSVVAEGVETPAQEESLRRLGCHAAQGWRYGRPEPASAVQAAVSPVEPGAAEPEPAEPEPAEPVTPRAVPVATRAS